MVTSKDVHEIVSLLSSDKAKLREEGVKLLNTWLDGERAIAFCHYLGLQTTSIKPSEIPHSESWPFLVSLLVQCVTSEVSSSKRRAPKLSFAKSLRIAVQRAEDDKFSGESRPLLPIVRTLFSHVWDILSNVPTFHTEYAVILRLLLSIRDYRFHFRNRIHNSLVIFYLEKIESMLPLGISSQKEELFRCILTLQSLIENPPGDFTDESRGVIVHGISKIISFLREENKISRKLIECVNILLLKDGPNLGTKYLKIHDAMWNFIFHVWTTTHDRGFKDILYHYANLQLNLARWTLQDDNLVDQILDLVCKDLDMVSSNSTGYLLGDTIKDEKAGNLRGLNCKLNELAARVLCRACSRPIRPFSSEKRIKREPMNVVLMEALTKGKWIWHSVFVSLIRKFYNRMSEDLIMYWFDGISSSLERIMNDSNLIHSYDGFLWTLRSLLELSIAFDISRDKSSISCSRNSKFYNKWLIVWRCLINGLPLYSNLTSLVEVALVLLGNIVRCNHTTTWVMPPDLWDLKLFQRPPSLSVLYFIACYFSHKVPQVDFRDSLRIRKNLLVTSLSILQQKDRTAMNEHMVFILPSAVFSLVTSSSLFENHYSSFLSSFSLPDHADVESSTDDEKECYLFDCSVDALARINIVSHLESSSSPSSGAVHLPQELTAQLLSELDCNIVRILEDDWDNNRSLSNAFFMCALLSNFIYGTTVLRQKQNARNFVVKSREHVVRLLDWSVTELKNIDNYFRGQVSLNSDFELRTTLVPLLRSFVGCPFFGVKDEPLVLDSAFYGDVIDSIERMLGVFVKHYELLSNSTESSRLSCFSPEFQASSDSSLIVSHSFDNKTTIVDLDLDVSDDRQSGRLSSVVGRMGIGLSVSVVERKLQIVSLISCLSPILNLAAWKSLFELMKKETNTKVGEKILHYLCQYQHCSSLIMVDNLVTFVSDLIITRQTNKLDFRSIITSINQLVCSLNSLKFNRVDEEKNTDQCSMGKRKFDEILEIVSQQMNSVFVCGLLDWLGRCMVVESICNMVILCPSNGQGMIGNLLLLLQDCDYRVRLKLAQRIGVLFQTWDGHKTLFEDMCSSLGLTIVIPLKTKRITANEVLVAGPQPYAKMETAVTLLMHLAYYSEKIELEAVFMMCAISALDARHRDLVEAAFDELSTQLGYSSRFQYLEHLMAPILFYWVGCGINLNALLEIQKHFISEPEPSYFIQYCCQWLLPALLLYDDNNSLNWVSQITCQSLKVLCTDHFVPIFAICMSLICCTSSDHLGAAHVLNKSILRIASMSEVERDKLIKKHMVAIVSRILSLTSCASDPPLPLFSRETISLAIHMVVDGFLEMNNLPTAGEIVDKINMFRPDRVFMFILEIHHQIEAATNNRHKREKLAGLEVLVDILGERASVISTTIYVLNLVGQLIAFDALGHQCCRLISDLLGHFEISSKDTFTALGDQLQFLVSKLVSAIIKANSVKESSTSEIDLLSNLIIKSSHFLRPYIIELEPFPDLVIFDEIREFQESLFKKYSPREHLLNLVTRSSYLPPKLLFWSVQALHKKWLLGEHISNDSINKRESLLDNLLMHDREALNAVWDLVYLCHSSEADGIKPLVCDFVCKIGIGDPHSVVIHLPEDPYFINLNRDRNNEVHLDLSSGISNELLTSVVQLLGKYLIDDSAKIVQASSQALRGILSTEKCQKALHALNSLQISIVKIHSNGVDAELVEKILLDLEGRYRAESIPLENSDLWQTTNKTLDSWICPLVYSLTGFCKDVILRLCMDVVLLKAELAEMLLPGVVVDIAGGDPSPKLHGLLSSQVEAHILTDNNRLNKSIQVFLDGFNELRICRILESSVATQQKLRSSKHCSKSAATTVKRRPSVATSTEMMITSSWEKVYWLTIDYLIVAKSAVESGLYFTAMLYVEHWCEDRFDELTLGSPDFSHTEVLPKHIEILVSAITQINEPDSLYGIIRSHKLSSQAVIYEQEGSWNKALEYYDLQVRSGCIMAKVDTAETLLVENNDPVARGSCPVLSYDATTKPLKGLIRSLQQIGCTHVLDLYCHGLTSTSGNICHDLEFSELQHEAAWRSGKWDFYSSMRESDIFSFDSPGKPINFNRDLHRCLTAFHEGDPSDFQKVLQSSKQELLRSIARASVESTEYIYSAFFKLKILHHLGASWNCRWTKLKDCGGKQKTLQAPVEELMSSLDADWNSTLNQLQANVGLLELMIAFRRVVLQILGFPKYAINHLLISSSYLRKGSRFSQAVSALHELKFLCTNNAEQFSCSYWFGRLEEAKLLRAQGHHETAISLADYICQNCQSVEASSDAHRLIGKWLAETRSSNSKTILEKHLKPALLLAEEQGTSANMATKRKIKCHFHLAHYTDALFRSYEERLSSNEWKTALHLRNLKKIELEELVRRFKSSRKEEKDEYSPKILELQKQLLIDQEEEMRLQDDRDNFLRLALEGYKYTLVIGDKYDVLVMFRLVSLWFNLSASEDVLKNMSNTIEEVCSYKFLPLVYQIASRMGSSNDSIGSSNFQYLLVSLLKKMAIDHPFHTIFQMLALANGDRIKEKQRNKSSYIVHKDKMTSARSLLDELSSSKPAIIQQMRQVVEIYIKLAEMETKREDIGKKVLLPRDVRGVRQLELVPVVTATVPVDRDCLYHEGSFPHFQGLSDYVVIMNGINAPKVVECTGSDGKKYRQLAKSGNDDLRQDAVMEQFFGLVNAFLQKNRGTRQRNLHVRTYKVVPLTPSAGVLEWVDGTVPLGDYLIGSTRDGGAHVRYRYDDWPFSKCREHMSNEKDKRKAFQDVCKNFRPVLHHFFLERFLQPADWFQKRLAYTRSVASSSMVGYIVGLGDRHSMNILIDQASAEVVHIDLGVAFEQGLMLKTPERVPFRLTRDIIDGMGITGVEGVFRRCCEETLSVMRTNKEALLTIVEVFIHDPLYKWALSPLKALQRQKDIDDDIETSFEALSDGYEGNKDAARALMRVKRKLEGYEEGELRSVRGQVQQLIQDAVDPERLCLMFPGWAAWL